MSAKKKFSPFPAARVLKSQDVLKSVRAYRMAAQSMAALVLEFGDAPTLGANGPTRPCRTNRHDQQHDDFTKESALKFAAHSLPRPKHRKNPAGPPSPTGREIIHFFNDNDWGQTLFFVLFRDWDSILAISSGSFSYLAISGSTRSVRLLALSRRPSPSRPDNSGSVTEVSRLASQAATATLVNK